MVDSLAGLVQVRSVHSKTVLWKGVSEDTLWQRGTPRFLFIGLSHLSGQSTQEARVWVERRLPRVVTADCAPCQSPDELFLVSHKHLWHVCDVLSI